MHLSELLNTSLVTSELQARSRDEAIRELAGVLAKESGQLQQEEIVRVVLEREALASTGIGEGIAIPHGSLSTINGLLGAMGRSTPGIDFQSVDSRPAHLIFLLVVPRSQPGVHLKTLANITKVLKNDGYREQLLQAPDAKAIMDALRAADGGGS
jgi:PTS system nitrogen regulatory IIA component